MFSPYQLPSCSDSGVIDSVGLNASLNNTARKGIQGRQVFREFVSLTRIVAVQILEAQ